jgi:hypothetical protein
MDWLKPDWDTESPTVEHIQTMWQDLEIVAEPIILHACQSYLEAICTTHVNGGAVLGQFLLKGDATLQWYASRHRLEDINFFSEFVSSRAVIDALEPLRQAVEIEWGNAFTLDGDLGFTLFQGGAYERFAGTSRQAKELGARVCDELFGDRFDEISVYKSSLAWSDWFYDVAWDVTWFIIDHRNCRIWMLCLTDTD